jgi:Alpha galactosidase A/Alpha galactosidase C-terminal beta sandwich domain
MTVRSCRRLLHSTLLFAVVGTTAVLSGPLAPAATAAAKAPAAATHTVNARPSNELLAQTPPMGWSSWSLESTTYPGVNPTGSASWLTEAHILQQADAEADELEAYGYDYVNIDAGWSNGFDQYGRPIANPTTFPDGIAYIANHVHAEGLKLGIYLAVGLAPAAYDNGNTPIYGAPGCTTADIVYPDLRLTNGWDSAYKIDYANPCAQDYINSIADEFASWGVDYLKLDGVGPGSDQGGTDYDNTPDVAAWSSALKATGRPIEFTLSWSLAHSEAPVWEEYSNGWRIDTDVECYCGTLVTWNNSVVQRWNDVVQWIPDAGPGHWNNLDSLDVGNGTMDGLTDAERQSYMTLWAIEDAPLISGDDLTQLDSYGLSLLTNRDVIAVDQAGTPARPVSQNTDQQVWYARNSDGSYTVALFNLGSSAATVTANWSDIGLSGTAQVTNLWTQSSAGTASGSISAGLPEHGSELLRLTPASSTSAPSVPTGVRGTASTGDTVSLAWNAAANATGYTVSVDGRPDTTVSGTSAEIAGLSPSTTHTFTVSANGASGGGSSAPSTAITVTTTPEAGPTGYPAAASANTLAGGAAIASCSGCAGGQKVGDLGGGGTLTYPDISVPVAGTYLMTLTYVDGDTGRSSVVTVNGGSFNLPTDGTGDNDWSDVQTVTVPVTLQAGTNTIEFSNPDNYSADVSQIAL